MHVVADAPFMRIAPIASASITRRRELLQRDPPVNFKEIVAAWRRMGWTTSRICFTLNITRGKLWHLENIPGSEPAHSDGEAIRKLDAIIRPKTDTHT